MNSILPHVIKTTFSNIESNKQLFLLSVVTNFIAFSVLGLFFLLFVNLNVIFSSWDKHVQLIVFLEDKVHRSDKNKIELLFASNDKIKSVVFVSRDQAWKSFQGEFSSRSKFVTSLKFNPLPDSYTLRFKNDSNRLNNIRNFSAKIKKVKGIESIEYGEKWIYRFEQFMNFFRGFIIAFAVLIFAGMIFIVSNTIKLSIYNRKDEIDLMSLLGATHRFIKTPLLFEGILQGLLGALLSLATVKAIHLYIIFRFQGSLESTFRGLDFQFLTNPIIFSIIFTGIIIGAWGSLLSVNHFLKMRNLE
jgi:cell division transport system permease protein